MVSTAHDPGPSPVVGWLLANHLTGTLLVHDPDGYGVVEGRLGLTPNGPAVDWAQLPDCPDTDNLDDPQGSLAQRCPQLFAFLTQLWQGRAEAFNSLMFTIDHSSWTTRDVSNDTDALASLIGQPVALLLARLTLDIDTLPFTDTSSNDWLRNVRTLRRWWRRQRRSFVVRGRRWWQRMG